MSELFFLLENVFCRIFLGNSFCSLVVEEHALSFGCFAGLVKVSKEKLARIPSYWVIRCHFHNMSNVSYFEISFHGIKNGCQCRLKFLEPNLFGARIPTIPTIPTSRCLSHITCTPSKVLFFTLEVAVSEWRVSPSLMASLSEGE